MLSGRAVFLDRDGTIIIDKRYLGDPSQVELERGALPGLLRMTALGLKLIGVTNQSGIAKRLFTVAAAEAVNRQIDKLLSEQGIVIERWYICPHDANDECRCRKPAPGMLFAAADDLGIDLARAFVVGDKMSDVELARAVQADGILVRTGEGASFAADAQARGYDVAADLSEAATLIERKLGGENAREL